MAVYDAGSHGQTHYLVMELIRGRTLRQELDEHGPLPAPRAVAIVSAVAAALQAAHAQGLIHRDVKPGNVMLTGDGQEGQVKVVDFGIARVADAAPITQTAALLGTPQYLAPEQAQGGPPDARSVFAPALEGLRGAQRARRLAQLITVTDVLTWKLLRHDRHLSRHQTELALIELLQRGDHPRRLARRQPAC